MVDRTEVPNKEKKKNAEKASSFSPTVKKVVSRMSVTSKRAPEEEQVVTEKEEKASSPIPAQKEQAEFVFLLLLIPLKQLTQQRPPQTAPAPDAACEREPPRALRS